jgi:hypothetical protein
MKMDIFKIAALWYFFTGIVSLVIVLTDYFSNPNKVGNYSFVYNTILSSLFLFLLVVLLTIDIIVIPYLFLKKSKWSYRLSLIFKIVPEFITLSFLPFYFMSGKNVFLLSNLNSARTLVRTIIDIYFYTKIRKALQVKSMSNE